MKKKKLPKKLELLDTSDYIGQCRDTRLREIVNELIDYLEVKRKDLL